MFVLSMKSLDVLASQMALAVTKPLATLARTAGRPMLFHTTKVMNAQS
jgi:hypothetical protein